MNAVDHNDDDDDVQRCGGVDAVNAQQREQVEEEFHIISCVGAGAGASGAGGKPSQRQQYRAKHDKRIAMKLEQKHTRRGDGADNFRCKRGAHISEKQWARLDDKARTRALEAGALPPHQARKSKAKRAIASALGAR